MSEESKLPRLIIDTNTIVSAYLSPGNFASLLLSTWKEDRFQWIQTPQTFLELEIVLNREHFRTKYGVRSDDVAELLETIAKGVDMVIPLPPDRLPILCRDPKDDIFLSAAFGGSCDYLVTGDQDLLVLKSRKELGNMEIVTVREFLERSGYLER